MTKPEANSADAVAADTSFEDALAQLQELIAHLEDGDLTLEQTIDDFRQGTAMAAHCQRLIADAELRITELSPSPESDPY